MSDDGKKHAPRTDAHGNADTVPTANASGMPRIFPRHKDKRTSAEQDEIDEKDGDAPDELGGRDDSGDEEDNDNEAGEEDQRPNYPPTGSLTLAAFDPYSSIPLSRRLALISGSIFINLGLPFLNGIMLGFGEIFARVVVAPALGITGVGWAGDTARAVVNWGTGRKTSDVGLGREKHYGGGFAQQRQPGDFDDWSATADATQGAGAHVEL